jgi:hypothetical protein
MMRREASRVSFLMCPFCVRVLLPDKTTTRRPPPLPSSPTPRSATPAPATGYDIAHHAGLGAGTAYRRFDNKEQIIDALFGRRI